MKLQTKLTLWFAGLLLLVAGALLLALYMISGNAEKTTAKTTLEGAVTSYAGELAYEHGYLRDFKGRTYENGAYLQIYSADGSELMAGTDLFDIAARMPDLLRENEAETVFHVETEGAGIYCYFLWQAVEQDEKGHGGRSGSHHGNNIAKETNAAVEDETDGVWVVGVLPEDSMDNLMRSVVRYACVGLPIIILLAALGGWAIAGHSLRPLKKITQSAREISDGHDLSRRIDIGPGKDETHELADTFNGMMGRLERSFEAERQFTSDASHELRTPVTVILAECEMAEKDASTAQESVLEIHKQARKMSELIGKLLSYTRLEQGTRRIDRERLCLGELAENICEEQRTVAAGNMRIECAAEPNVYVEGDAALLISLVQNLVTNAVKYGKDNGHVYVRVYAENGNACLSVQDDGIGISEKDLDRIWNRFYQADTARSGEARGAGLGLSLAQQIARLHGGRITASSKLGEGSTFLFTMPLA